MLSIGPQACSMESAECYKKSVICWQEELRLPRVNILAELWDKLQAFCAQHSGNVLQTRGIPMLTSIVHAMTAQLLPFLGSWVFPSIQAA